MALTGNEVLQVQGTTTNGFPAGPQFQTTTGEIAALANAGASFTFRTVTTDSTLLLADAGNGILINDESDNNLTVPSDATANLPVNAVVVVYPIGAGQTTVVAAVGVTVNTSAPTTKLRTTYSGITLQKIAANTWILSGDLALS